MEKKSIVKLMLCTLGGILFAIGMCMCLIPEWNAFTPGVVLAAIGGALLLALLAVQIRLKLSRKVHVSGRKIGAAAFGVIGALALGLGMCMIMVWQNLMIYGMIVGIIGILMLVALIPICKGTRA